jgi:hypothetical protein
MAKYRKFYYNAGYIGTTTEVAMKFSDDTTENEIKDIFDEWVEEQHCYTYDFTDITEEEAEEMGIEDEY